MRENYARADVGGVIIVFELDSVEEASRYTDDFPLSKAGLLEWVFLAFDSAPLPLEYLFDPTSTSPSPGTGRQHDPVARRHRDPDQPAEWCDPSRMALVVYDMQVGICRQVAGAADIVERTGIVLRRRARPACGWRSPAICHCR